MLTGLFNQNNAENLPPSSVTIECYVNKDKTIIDLCVLLFIPSSLQDKTMSTVDGVFTANYGQTGRDLKGKNILITGASRGLGKKMAEALAIQGAHVIFNYRGDLASAELLKQELLKLGASKATALLFDVTNTAQMKEAIEQYKSITK